MSFEEIYENKYKIMVNLAKHYLDNDSLAEDVVQDVFTKSLEFIRANPKSDLSYDLMKKHLITLCVIKNKQGSNV